LTPHFAALIQRHVHQVAELIEQLAEERAQHAAEIARRDDELAQQEARQRQRTALLTDGYVHRMARLREQLVEQRVQWHRQLAVLSAGHEEETARLSAMIEQKEARIATLTALHATETLGFRQELARSVEAAVELIKELAQLGEQIKQKEKRVAMLAAAEAGEKMRLRDQIAAMDGQPGVSWASAERLQRERTEKPWKFDNARRPSGDSHKAPAKPDHNADRPEISANYDKPDASTSESFRIDFDECESVVHEKSEETISRDKEFTSHAGSNDAKLATLSNLQFFETYLQNASRNINIGGSLGQGQSTGPISAGEITQEE
jgi:hypothetical protein